MTARDVLSALFGNPGNRWADSAAATRIALHDAAGSSASATWSRSARCGLISGVLAVALLLGLGAVPALAAAPVATVENATNVEYTSADFAGTVNPAGSPTQWRFEYITDAAFQENLLKSRPGFSEASVPLAGTSTSSEPVSGHVEGLHAGTVYHLRLFVKNVHGSDSKVASNFTTKAVAAPVLSEVEVKEVEYATFTAKGKVQISNADPAFNASTCRFEVATQAQWEAAGNSFPEGPFAQQSEEPVVNGCSAEPTGPGTTSVVAKFEGPGYSPYNPPPGNRLPAGTTYHLRLTAGNQSGAPSHLAAASTFATKAVAKAALTGPTQSSVTATSAHIAGTVAPNSPEPVTDVVKAGYNVHWFFRCTPECNFAANPGGEVEAGQPATEVSTELMLQPNLSYTVTLHAINAGGEQTAQTVFSTPASAPEVRYPFGGAAVNRTANSLRFAGLVNPNNSLLTDCHFDYGTTTGYGQSVPCTAKPTGGAFARVEADVTGLQPATTYHLRLVAANSAGPVIGADRTTRSLATPVTPTCGNDEVRLEQHAELLPECRAWEMVSPLDKNGGGVTSEAPNVLASANGDAAQFVSRAGFAETKSTGPVGMTQYVSQRGQEGWTTSPISPLQNHTVLQTLFTRDEAGVFSEDLSKAVMLGYDLPGQTDDLSESTNIYQEDTGTGALQTVTSASQLTGSISYFDFVNNIGVGASGDAETIAFEVSTRLLPEATEGVSNVYEWDHGTLRVAGVLPNGTVPSEGSTMAQSNVFFFRYRESVSNDGLRIAFRSPAEGGQQLFLRRNHTSTALVSEAEGTGVTAPENVRLQWMSPDGKHLLFTTTSKMLPGDSNETSDLYLYTDGPNPSSESNLDLISGPPNNAASREAGVEGAVLGASDDAGRIYYIGETCGCGEYELMYSDHGVNKQVVGGIYGQFDWGSTSYPSQARVSADGLRLAFVSTQQLTSHEVVNSAPEMYVYDATDESLTCASCQFSGVTEAEATVIAHATLQGLTKEMPQVRPHWLSDDGKKVFFSTAAALAPGDINELTDVYAYYPETGERRLISSGRGEDGAWFEDASKDGSNAFFVTRQSLVSRDGDPLVDLYDARVGGGFLEPPPPPASCSGDGCRGALSSVTPVSSPATSSFSGPGNPKPHRKHHKKKHHKKKHHKRGNNGGGK